MKKFFALYKPYMNRLIFNISIKKFATALAILFVWNYFFNKNDAFMVVRDGCLIPALIYMAAAWFAYLKLDGMSVDLGLNMRRKRPKKVRFNKGMMDYVETDLVSYEELSHEERLVCRIASNFVPGILFLLASLGAMLFS